MTEAIIVRKNTAICNQMDGTVTPRLLTVTFAVLLRDLDNFIEVDEIPSIVLVLHLDGQNTVGVEVGVPSNTQQSCHLDGAEHSGG